jgi:hypothetical protein
MLYLLAAIGATLANVSTHGHKLSRRGATLAGKLTHKHLTMLRRGTGAFSIQAHAPESIKMLYLHRIGAFCGFHETTRRSGRHGRPAAFQKQTRTARHDAAKRAGASAMTAAPQDRRFMQMCWVVPDLRSAVDTWLRTTGVGPFFMFDSVTFDSPRYRGEAAACPPISAAMAQAGDLQIELVSQNDDRPSFWRDVVPAGKSGLHHMALYCSDYDTALAAYIEAGSEIAFSGLMMGSRVCWVDTCSKLGFMVELIEANPVADNVFSQFRLAAQNWDGRNPIRSLG